MYCDERREYMEVPIGREKERERGEL